VLDWRADAPLRSELARGLDAPAGAEAGQLAAFLAHAFGPAAVALVHYGSHTHAAGAPEESAWDFFVVVDDYRAAYRALAAAQPGRIPAGRAAALNRVLPPNVIAISTADPIRPLTAKCCVLSLADLASACSPAPRDHFVRARLFQPLQLVWSRDAAGAASVTDAILAVRAGTFDWIRPFLPARFDASSYARALLEISYRAEIRPEDGGRIETLLAAQGPTLFPIYEALLASLAARGVLAREAGGYRDPAPPGPLARFLARRWFGWSKLRVTLRWAKYVALYDDWLDYVVLKVERRSGRKLDLTPRERRWPLLFLWPKALRFLGTRPQRRRG
jgi:hypothetical protein